MDDDRTSEMDDSTLEAMLDGPPDAVAAPDKPKGADAAQDQDQQDAEDQQELSDRDDDRDDAADGDGQKRGDPAVALRSARQTAREAREALRRAEAQAAQERATFQAILDRMERIGTRQPAQTGAQPPQDADPLDVLNRPIPKWEDDPDGHQAAIEAQQRAIVEIARERQQTQRQTAEQRQQAEAQHAVMNVAQQHRAEFMHEAPDYDAAEKAVLSHYQQHYSREGKYLGLSGPALQRFVEHNIHSGLQNIVINAHRSGGNAAATIYAMAGELGYAPGGQPAPAQRRDVGADIADKAAKAKTTRSLGGAAGAAPKSRMSASEIGALNPAEIAKYSDEELGDLLGLR